MSAISKAGTEFLASSLKISSQDLIMMNVPEKLSYMRKRQKYLDAKQEETGITQAVKDVLEKRGMVPSNL